MSWEKGFRIAAKNAWPKRMGNWNADSPEDPLNAMSMDRVVKVLRA
jgi:hypothetical protein